MRECFLTTLYDPSIYIRLLLGLSFTR